MLLIWRGKRKVWGLGFGELLHDGVVPSLTATATETYLQREIGTRPRQGGIASHTTTTHTDSFSPILIRTAWLSLRIWELSTVAVLFVTGSAQHCHPLPLQKMHGRRPSQTRCQNADTAFFVNLISDTNPEDAAILTPSPHFPWTRLLQTLMKTSKTRSTAQASSYLVLNRPSSGRSLALLTKPCCL